MLRACITAATLAIACAAHATTPIASDFRLRWVEIDNSVNPVINISPLIDPFGFPFHPDNYRTFRLFVEPRTPGNKADGITIAGADMGDHDAPVAGDNALYTNGTVYNHGLGGNFGNPGLHGFSASIYFDTYVAFGSTAPTNIAAVPGSMFLGNNGFDMTVGTAGLRGIWSGDPQTLGMSGVMLLQITVEISATFLGGPQVSYVGEGVAPASRLTIISSVGDFNLLIPNAIPTPGCAALLGLGGLLGVRRRR